MLLVADMDLEVELERFQRIKIELLVLNYCIPILENLIQNEYCDGCFHSMGNQEAHTCIRTYRAYEDEDDGDWWTDTYERQFENYVYNIVHAIDRRLFLDELTKIVQYSFDDPTIYINKLSDSCWRDNLFINILPGGILYEDVKGVLLKKYDDELTQQMYAYRGRHSPSPSPSPPPSPPRKKPWRPFVI